jgi:hypothetical protein
MSYICVSASILSVLLIICYTEMVSALLHYYLLFYYLRREKGCNSSSYVYYANIFHDESNATYFVSEILILFVYKLGQAQNGLTWYYARIAFFPGWRE